MTIKELFKQQIYKKGYQEFIKFFRYLRIYLEQALPEYEFTSNITENNMDYSYFQFTNRELKAKGIKYVVAFVHLSFNYEVWLSGFNRKIQKELYSKIKNQKPNNYLLTDNPNSTDYVLKNLIVENCDYNELDQLLHEMKSGIVKFLDKTRCL